MSMYRHHSHRVPGLNTSSLPDLIFTVLFFFMIVTHMRKANVMVKYQVPAGKELTKLTKRSATTYLYVGYPMGQKGAEPNTIQLNDKVVSVNEIRSYMIQERNGIAEEDREKMEVSIKADKNVRMGIITDIKQALRKAEVLRINYSGTNFNKDNAGN